MANISYWDEYDIIHNNRGEPMNVINSKLDDLYGESKKMNKEKSSKKNPF